MPSGSHRTSGGSHSSGGSSRGGSSFGSGSSYTRNSSTTHFPRRGYRRFRGVYFGGHQLGPVGTIIFFIIFLLVFSGGWFAAGTIINSQKNIALSKIEADYNYYQNMIQVAETQRDVYGDDSFFVTGIITGKFLSDYEGKWYLTYKFPANSHNNYPGETYAIYSSSDVANIIPNVSTIELVVDSPNITSITDSIEYSYKNTKLEDDGNYISIKKSNMFPIVICYIVSIGSAALFIFLIVKEVKNLKASKEENSDISTLESPKNSLPTKKYCAYCGTENSLNAKKCSSCGAKIDYI